MPLTLVAAAAALIVPSAAAARRSELLLAALVALTALGIDPRRLGALRRRPGAVLALSAGPLLVLAPLGWALGRLLDGAVRDGLLALGVAPTEVAAVGLVALAGADAVLALAVVAGPLVCSAVLGPFALAALGGSRVSGLDTLLVTFALVVLVPLAAGLGARAAVPALARVEDECAAGAALAVAGLVYAALSGARCRRRRACAGGARRGRVPGRVRRARAGDGAATTSRRCSASRCATSPPPPRSPRRRSARAPRWCPASTA